MCPTNGKSKYIHILANDTEEKVEIRSGWVYIIDFFLLSYTDYQRLKIFFENDYVCNFISDLNIILQPLFKEVLYFACFMYCVWKVVKIIEKKFGAKYANIGIRN